MNPTVYIMIGLPGSGKSEWVKRNLPEAGVCSADHYFYDANGEYHFDGSLIVQAHNACFQAFEIAIGAYYDQIVIDNTNLLPNHYKKYVDLAIENHYNVELIYIGDGGLTDDELAARNKHGVTAEAISRLRQRMNSHPHILNG